MPSSFMCLGNVFSLPSCITIWIPFMIHSVTIRMLYEPKYQNEFTVSYCSPRQQYCADITVYTQTVQHDL
jgi:hypothetical protein